MKIDGFTQSLARLEMWYALFGNVYGFAAARVATDASGAAGDRETAKTADFDALALNKGGTDRVLNGFYSMFCVTLGELVEACCQLFN